VGADSFPAADAHALKPLQFDRVLDAVAGFASTLLGADAVRALIPRSVPAGDRPARDAVIAEHGRVGAMRRLVTSEDGWPAQPIPPIFAALSRLEVPGAAWAAAELRQAITLLASSRAQLGTFRVARSRDIDVAALDAMARALVSDAALEQALDRVVDEAGDVRNGASHDLRKIRKQLRGAEADLIRLLERVIAKLDPRHRVDDASVTMRNGRWVVPVRREGRNALGGIVHDTSQTGATVFVEPPAAVEFGNRIRELESAEIREVERILAETTEALRPRAVDLVETLHALVALDSLVARARFAERYACAPVEFAAVGQGFSIVEGRHPLLVTKDPSAVVPFSLSMLPDEHTLLVSGPNTGGKTVLLKAVALLSLMAQAGVPATVAAGSVLPLFDRVFADIGDEQSIEASLSTFSGHVRNLIEIVEDATAASLVLADELGSGTDPNEGAALGAAILEALTRRGVTTVATTHLGALKELALEVPGVVNASLQFDEAALAPTYRLMKGIPGRSYGLSIARRLAMPAAILENAEARVPEAERNAAALIEDLERRQQELGRRERDAEDREGSYAVRADRVLEREQAIRARERELEREARESSRRYLLDARKEIEAAIAAIRSAASAGTDGTADAASNARRLAEQLLAAEREAVRALDEDEAAELAPAEGTSGEVRVGDLVAVATFGGVAAQVIEARPDALVVLMGSVRTTVPPGAVRRMSRKQAASQAASQAESRAQARAEPRVPVQAAGGDQPEHDARHEIDVRGVRISEIDGLVQHALDSAVRAALPALRIIHGKGTGALRERVGELLRDDRRVRSHRLGAWNEGGAGVTVAELA
jgi:DNA mismatch repair protein MutS2